MNRNQFIASSMVVSGATLIRKPRKTVLPPAKNSYHEGIDKLTDSEGNFQLQPLPYSENYLEPIIDAETLNLHYHHHHGAAVAAANYDLQMIKTQLEANSLENIDYWTKKLSHHLSSHVLHSIYWTNLTRERTTPNGILLSRIEKDFDSFEKMRTLLLKACKEVDGNGWGILGYQPYSDRLTITQCENHEKLTQWGVIPLLVLDVYEHAYYLKYKNRRKEYIENLFLIINWANVSERLNSALRIGR